MRNWLQPNLLAQAPKKQTALTVKHLMLKELGSREKSSITLMETG